MMPSSSGTRKKLANRPSSTATPPSSPRKSQRRSRGDTIDDSRRFIARSLGKVDGLDRRHAAQTRGSATRRSEGRVALQRHGIGVDDQAAVRAQSRGALEIEVRVREINKASADQGDVGPSLQGAVLRVRCTGNGILDEEEASKGSRIGRVQVADLRAGR